MEIGVSRGGVKWSDVFEESSLMSTGTRTELGAFEAEVVRRLPLAESVWILLRHVCDPARMDALFERHRGTGWKGIISFGLLAEMVSEALLHYRGSGLQSFDAARKDGRLTATIEAAYGKLRRVPAQLSEAFLAETTARLREVRPEVSRVELPPALRQFAVLVVDGKKVKNLAKRLAPLRSLRGKALAGKALAALLLNEGLVIGMEVSLDGEANDAPLTPGLLAQVDERLPGLRHLYIADRQFCDLKIPHAIADRGDYFLIRFSQKMLFSAEKSRVWQDAAGRVVREEWGWLGRAADPRRIYVRRLTVERPGEEDVSVVTNLLDAEQVPGEQLLAAYLQRWSIERVFQQLTEVFTLEQLISSSPEGAIFQFAVCALLYNVVVTLREYIAQAQDCEAPAISSEKLFGDVRKELTACCELVEPSQIAETLDELPTTLQVRSRLTTLLAERWDPRWIKSPAKTKSPPRVKTPTRGGHFSAWKVLQKHKLNKTKARSP
jgi:hypothetical protein